MSDYTLEEIERLRAAAKVALYEMLNTVAPRQSFTDAVDALDTALDAMDPDSPFKTAPDGSPSIRR